jgi:heat shock protein 5
MSKLKREVEKAKRVLSSEEYTTLDIDDFHNGRDFSATLTRAKFEELNQDLFKQTLNKVEDVLRDAKIEKDQVTDVVLVGGSTRIPKIRQMLTEHFSSKKLRTGIDPDEAVAHGAAIQGGILSGANGLGDCGLLEVSPFSLGIETDGGKMATIIRRFSPIPTRNKQTFSTTQDNQDTVQIKVFEGIIFFSP